MRFPAVDRVVVAPRFRAEKVNNLLYLVRFGCMPWKQTLDKVSNLLPRPKNLAKAQADGLCWKDPAKPGLQNQDLLCTLEPRPDSH